MTERIDPGQGVWLALDGEISRVVYNIKVKRCPRRMATGRPGGRRSCRCDAARLIRRLVRASRTPRTENPYAQISEVARAFAVTDQTVRNWVDRGWLPSERSFTGRRKIPRTVLASAIALQRPRPGTPDFSPERLAEILNAPRRR